MTSTNPFGDHASQLDMLTAILDAFPATNLKGSGAQKVPIQPKARRPWAEQLYRRGVRVDPALMEEFPIPTGSGFLASTNWVDREAYDKHVAQAPSPAQTVADFRELLKALDPDLAARIESMGPDERRAAMAEHAQQLAAAGERVAEIREQIAKEDQ